MASIAIDTAEPRGKLFAGPRVRRLRSQLGLTQTRMAEELGVSISYLNLIERNQRPLTAPFLLKLSHQYNLDLRQLTGADDDRLALDVAEALADPLLKGLDVGRAEVQEFVAASPGIAQAIVRLRSALRDARSSGAGAEAPQGDGPLELVRAFIQDRRNHFPELETRAESLADELRLAAPDFFAAVSDRLRARHGLTVRILPAEVMPELLRRLDLHGRQLQLSELLDPASRSFQAAYQLALSEGRGEIDAIVARAGMPDAASERLLVQNLANYFAAALMMPYGRFHTACEATGYDLDLLQARFSAGLEQVAHRLTTLQRPGARGIPFFLVRVDRAGNISKRFSAGGFPFSRHGGNCPLWTLHKAFERPGQILRQLVEMEDGTKYVSIARTVRAYAQPYGGVRPEYAIALGCEARHAHGLVYARGLDLGSGDATPIGLGCELCERPHCRQRARPPANSSLIIDEKQRGPNPVQFGHTV
ncbi:helix-turn-helix domain-containing protein [Sphingosinicella xenopeptidilytica]|uniref:Short-chain fatty acyl-CoA regulator family protein n=1 Tax=Sphingosinicella xenopeptidilytica TaxID=364098 RepID=A0ABW3C1N5_SPHXN